MPRKNSEIHIDVSHSRQPLVKGERLVRYEVNTVISYVSGVSYTKFQILQLGYLHNTEIQMKHVGLACIWFNRIIGPRASGRATPDDATGNGNA
jgi:hypothetical protein